MFQSIPVAALRPFEAADHDLFFGREELVERLLAMLADVVTEPQPMLVVVGEEDEITPVEGAREMAAAAGAELEIIAGAGHAAPVERPREVAAALRVFMEGLG